MNWATAAEGAAVYWRGHQVGTFHVAGRDGSIGGGYVQYLPGDRLPPGFAAEMHAMRPAGSPVLAGRKLPQPRDIGPINITDGMDSAEFVRRLRDDDAE